MAMQDLSTASAQLAPTIQKMHDFYVGVWERRQDTR